MHYHINTLADDGVHMKAFYILPLVTAIACETGQKMESEVICADQENGTASLWYLDK